MTTCTSSLYTGINISALYPALKPILSTLSLFVPSIQTLNYPGVAVGEMATSMHAQFPATEDSGTEHHPRVGIPSTYVYPSGY